MAVKKRLHKDYSTLAVSMAEEVEALGDALDLELGTSQKINAKQEKLMATASALLAGARTNLEVAAAYLKKVGLRTNLKRVNAILKSGGMREVGK